MSDTKKQDNEKLVEDRIIDSDENMYLHNRDNPDWPKAIKKPRPKMSELPDHLISKKQLRGISRG